MPAQGHKSGRLVAVSVTAAVGVTHDALVHAVQAWVLHGLAPARYAVVGYVAGDGAVCTVRAVAGKPRRADNLRVSLRTSLGAAGVEAGHVAVRVRDGREDLGWAAEALRTAPPSAVVQLEGWNAAELLAASAGGDAGAGGRPRLRFLPRKRAFQVLVALLHPRDVLARPGREPPHGGDDWALCPPDAACDACREFSDDVSPHVSVEPRTVLRAALRAGWDVSALYERRELEGLGDALSDAFCATYLAPPTEGPPRKRRRVDGPEPWGM